MRDIQQTTDTRVEQLAAGAEPPRRRPTYADVTRRLENIIHNYQNTNNEHFLRSVAHNFSL